MRKAKFVIAMTAVAVCMAAAPARDMPMTVLEANAAIVSLDGLTVSVQGWLTDPCGGYSCAIFATATKQGYDWPAAPYLSIAAGTNVETALVANRGREVVLRGVLSAECRPPRGRCTDRAADITPISVTPVHRTPEDR